LALDRQSIEKRDFPINRRGYEPEVVDAHLQAIADEVEVLKRAARPRPETLATAASEQVRTIVEAAEKSAADIRHAAEEDAHHLTADAQRDADEARAQAIQQAREHVQLVGEATTVMRQRIDAMESELGALVESLRTGANRLSADLSLLDGNMRDLGGVATSGPAHVTVAVTPAPEAPVAAPPPPTEEPATEVGPAFAAADLTGAAEYHPEPPPPPAPEPVRAPPTPSAEAHEGARLVALNMALSGTPRDETDRYLAENFAIEDRGAILDEVYAQVGG